MPKNSPGGRDIILNSSNPTLYTLLKSTLESCLECRCHHRPRSPFFSPPNDTGTSRALFMFDCFGYRSDTLLQMLQPELVKLGSSHQVALFNLSRTTRMEPQALKIGIRGFFYAHDSIDTLTKGVQAIFNNEVWVSRQDLLECIAGNSHRSSMNRKTGDRPAELTAREVDILSLLTTGKSNNSIAEHLCLSPHTVRTHIYNIYRKINVTNRCQATIWSHENPLP